jgi:hypothetical protein
MTEAHHVTVKVLLAATGIFIATLVVLLGLFLVVPNPRQGFLDAHIDKQRLVATAPSPKIVLVGGSNVAMGVDSTLLESKFGYTVVNMGLGRGLGLRYQIAEVTPFLKPGDWVLVLPEYRNYFSGFLDGRPDVLGPVLESSWHAARYMTGPQLIMALDGALTAMSIRLNRLLLQSSESPSVMNRRGFDRHGDFIGHLNAKRPDDTNLDFPLFSDTDVLSQDSIVLLNTFVETQRGHGVSVVLDFPPIPVSNLRRSEKKIDDLYVRLKMDLKIPFLNSPRELTFPDELFYDNHYHLGAEGRRQRTEILVSALSKLMHPLPAEDVVRTGRGQ